jgi:hypothetical protein
MSTPTLRSPRPAHGPRSRALRTCPTPRAAAPIRPSRARRLVRRFRTWLTSDDRGMSTVEYAIGTLAAAAFAAVLYTVISGDNVVAALTGLVQRALETTF